MWAAYFLPEDMGIPFDRNKYNLPLYTSADELQSIFGLRKESRRL
jgi:hypothetical protein